MPDTYIAVVQLGSHATGQWEDQEPPTWMSDMGNTTLETVAAVALDEIGVSVDNRDDVRVILWDGDDADSPTDHGEVWGALYILDYPEVPRTMNWPEVGGLMVGTVGVKVNLDNEAMADMGQYDVESPSGTSRLLFGSPIDVEATPGEHLGWMAQVQEYIDGKWQVTSDEGRHWAPRDMDGLLDYVAEWRIAHLGEPTGEDVPY